MPYLKLTKIFVLMLIPLLLAIGTDYSILNHEILSAESTNDLEDIQMKKSFNEIFELDKQDLMDIEKAISSMPLYEKCAQMIMPSVYTNSMNPSSRNYDEILSLVRDHGVGGVVMFQGGIDTQTKMIKAMQNAANIPLLISADFENGLGMRVDEAVQFPHNMALGATFNPEYSYKVGKSIACESRKFGFNFNLAPVSDINNNPQNPIINIRSYSEDKNIVSSFVNSFIKGSDEGKVLTSLKHFPGHGNTYIDSHSDLPKIEGNKDWLLNNELLPFIDAINKGAKAVMTGHLEVPSFDVSVGVPASLSYHLTTKLLQEQLGFEGIIITDALDMKAVTKYYTPQSAVINAVLAGNDIILAPENAKDAIRNIYDAVNGKKITEERIDKSVRKILAAKKWLGLLDEISVLKESLKDEQKLLAQEIANKSVTLLKNINRTIPLNLNDYKNVLCITIQDGNGSSKNEKFSRALKETRSDINSIGVNIKTKKKEFDNILKSVNSSDLVIIASFIRVKSYQGPVDISSKQSEFIKKILASGKKIVFISFNNPYLLSSFPTIENYICTYSNTEFSQQSALEAILGRIDFSGRLPVSIPNTEFVVGDGIKLKKIN